MPGTGLGLAICADLVGAAGGELRLEEGLPRPDGSGHGFAAVVALPVAPQVASSPGTRIGRRPEARLQSPAGAVPGSALAVAEPGGRARMERDRRGGDPGTHVDLPRLGNGFGAVAAWEAIVPVCVKIVSVMA